VSDPPDPPSPPPGSADGAAWSVRIVLPGEDSAVRDTLLSLRGRLARGGCGPEMGARLELVLAEVLNNIVEHAYAGGRDGAITLLLRGGGASVWCLVEDHGRPLPRFTLPDPAAPDPAALPAGDLPEGGFGWALIRRLSRGLSYERVDGMNRLSFWVDP